MRVCACARVECEMSSTTSRDFRETELKIRMKLLEVLGAIAGDASAPHSLHYIRLD